MRIFHVSDTHGLPRMRIPEDIEVVVHTGDMLPNKSSPFGALGAVEPFRVSEARFQEHWLRKNIYPWMKWLEDRAFIYVGGNHDFIDPCEYMRKVGVCANNVWLDKGVTVDGVRFEGLPFTPDRFGWNHERPEDEAFAAIEEILEREPDVIMTHCPPKYVLDSPRESFDGRKEHIGYMAYTAVMDRHATVANPYSMRAELRRPKHWLFGHCHEQGGKTLVMKDTTFHNNATTHAVIELG